MEKKEIVKEICCSYGYHYDIYEDGRVVLDDGLGVDHPETTNWLNGNFCGHMEYNTIDEMLLDWLPQLKDREKSGMITETLAEEIRFIEQLKKERENSMKTKELTVVVISYSFDAEVVAVVFDDYKKACSFIKEDFENEKRIDLEENAYVVDEENTYCEEGEAVLTTISTYSGDMGSTTWKIARTIEKNNDCNA